jgi:APA family basic amino acid/polyamine antiporter
MWQQISFVIGSILGSGIFILPFSCSPYRFSGVVGFTLVSLLFLFLGNMFSNSQSPFKLMKKHLGDSFAFFISWAYWMISWVSTIVVLKELVLYASNILPIKGFQVQVEIFLVLIFTLFNCFGYKNSNRLEFLLSFLKIFCLVLIPVFCFTHGKSVDTSFNFGLLLESLPGFVWCFVGIECASMVNQDNKGILTGIVIVSFIYIANIMGIFYLLGYSVSQTSYSQALYCMGYSSKSLDLIVSLICAGTLNSWVVSSGMCALDMAQTGFFPNIFTHKNRYGSPYVSIIVSSIGLIPLSILLKSQSSFASISNFLSLSSAIFLLFYTLFSFSYFLEEKSLKSVLVSIVCFVMFLFSGGVKHSILIGFSGIPLFLYRRYYKTHFFFQE